MRRGGPSPGRRLRALGVVALTLIPLFVVADLYRESIRGFLDARQWDDWWSTRKTVRQYAGYQLRGWLGALEASRLRLAIPFERHDPGTLRLSLPAAAWDRFRTDPQAAFQTWVDAELIEGMDFHPVKMRLRGDTSVHWLTEKPSFTLRSRRENLFRGHRDLALSSKDALSQFVVARLAAESGLLVPETALVHLFVNDRFEGLYRVLELPGDSFLRRHRRLPGNILRGDTAAHGEVFKDRPPLFFNPLAWDRVAADARPESSVATTIAALLDDMADGVRGEARARFRARFDLDEIARFLAIQLVAGNVDHLSDYHNQFWYDDPSDGRLHPVPWDLYYGDLRAPRGPVNRLMARFLAEPEVVEGALRYVMERNRGGALEARTRALVANVMDRFGDAVGYDLMRRGAVKDVGDPAEIAATLAANIRLLEKWARETSVAWTLGPVQDGRQVLDVEVSGRAGADLAGFEEPPDVRLCPSDANGQFACGERCWRLRHEDPPFEPVALIPRVDAGVLPFGLGRSHFRFFVHRPAEGVDPGAAPTLRPKFRNRITGEEIVATRLEVGAPLAGWPEGGSRLPEPPAPRTIRWSGNVFLKEPLVVEAGSELVVEPGGHIVLAEGVSLLVKGRLVAEGTKDQPISFVLSFASKAEDKPWGPLAIVGPGADGSRLRECRFRGGSGGRVQGIPFRGMVSVHHAKDVRFTGCEFRGELAAEAAVSVVHAQADFVDCRFPAAKGDALEFAFGGGSVAGCRVEDADRDAVKLVASDARVLDSAIRRARGRGVAVIGGGAPLIAGCVIEGCERGIEVADGGAPWIVRNRIGGGGTGIRQAVADWMSGAGGRARLAANQVAENARDFEDDARSRSFAPARDADAARIADAVLAQEAGAAIAEIAFEEDFESARDGWEATGDAPIRLAKKDRDLVLRVPRGEGSMQREVSWTTSAPALALVEVSLENAASAEIRFESDGGRAPETLAFGRSTLESRLVAVPLGPGTWKRVVIRAAAAGAPARVLLHRITVLPAGAGS